MQGGIDGFYVIQNLALGHEQVLPAIVVEIFQTCPPAGAACRHRPEARLEAAVREEALAIIVVKTIDFARKPGHEEIRSAIVIVVLKDGTHAGEWLAIGGERRARFES